MILHIGMLQRGLCEWCVPNGLTDTHCDDLTRHAARTAGERERDQVCVADLSAVSTARGFYVIAG